MSTAPQTRSGPGILLSTTITAVLAGVGAALAFAVVDGVLAGSRTAAASTTGTLLLSLCLYAPVGLVMGLLWGPIHGGLLAALPGTRARLRDEEELDRTVAAGILAAALALLVEVLLVHGFVTLAANAMSNRGLAALSTGLVAAAGVAVCAAAFFPLFVLLKGPARFFPRVGSATATTATVLLLAVVGAGVVILGRVDWRVLRIGPWVTLAALAVATALLTLMLSAWLGGKARITLGLAALVAALGLTLAAPNLDHEEQRVTPAQNGVLLPMLVSLGRGLKDHDGDGYSPWFNGGDCDDGNARVNPAERDIPGNGVDENCLGGDARIKKVVKKKVQPAAKPKRPAFTGNILLLCIDTLRADKLGVLGNPDGLTPNLDRLAKQGTLFSGAFAQGPNTPQSFPSIFTSQYPSRVPFRRRFTNYPSLKPSALSVFEVLRDAGVVTAAVTSHHYFKKKRGITQGIKDWDNRGAKDIKGSNADIASPRIVPRAVARFKALAAARKRFALFVHLFEPHGTYVRHRQFPITRRGTAGLRQKYDFEIKFADLWVGKLMAGLKKAGLYDNTAIVVFSDHGESLGEHRLYFHGQALYNEVINVPLIVRVPGAPGQVVKERVALLDIAPTMLDLVGIPAPEAFQGRSLLPVVHREAAPARRRIGALLMRYPSWPKGWRAMISGDYKVLHRVTENRLEIYNLTTDPGEKKNLARTDPALAKKLRLELARFAEEEL